MPLESTGSVRHALLDDSSSFDVVAAVSGKSIRVLALFATVANVDGVAHFESNADSDLTGPLLFAANGQILLPFNPAGHFQTLSGEKLNIVLVDTGQVSGMLTYQEVVPE